LLTEKGWRIGEDYLSSDYNASEFCSKLLEKPVVAHVIPHQLEKQVLPDITIKAAVSPATLTMYVSRMGDLQ